MQAPNNNEVELFVLQRSGFSGPCRGPRQEPSVDCLRLFTSRREAEVVGFHIAQEFAQQSVFKNSAIEPTRQEVNELVKIISLPPSTAGGDSSYTFQTCGKLFSVRSLKATIVSPALFPFVNTPHFTSAHVVLTQGIIGGTGNPSSRCGAEVSEGRVFVGTDDSQANQCAVQVAKQLHEAMRHSSPNVNITVAHLPIDKPQHGTVPEWPGALCPPHATVPMSTDNSNKRGWSDPSQSNQPAERQAPDTCPPPAAVPMSIVVETVSNKREWADPSSQTNHPTKRQCQVCRS